MQKHASPKPTLHAHCRSYDSNKALSEQQQQHQLEMPYMNGCRIEATKRYCAALCTETAKSRGQQAFHQGWREDLRMASPRFLEDERPLALVALSPLSPLAAPLPTASPPTGKPPRLWADL